MSKPNEDTQEPKVKIRSLNRATPRAQETLQETPSLARNDSSAESTELSEAPSIKPTQEPRRAVKGKAKKGVPVRHLCLDEQRDRTLFQLQLATSQQLGRRVTVSELTRVGVDCLGEMDMEELLHRLNAE